MKKILKHAGNMYELLNFAVTRYGKVKVKERIFHGNGTGYYGNFTLNKDLSEYTNSQFLTNVGKKFKVAVRFSNTISDHGTPELLRDSRGFCIRFFGDNESWDILGLSTPIQWIDVVEDTMTFHDIMNRDTASNVLEYDNKWNFVNNTPSALHVITMIYSDTGIPQGWENMNGYGCNVFSLIKEDGKRTWVKFHFKTQQGRDFYTDEEAALASFYEPDQYTRKINKKIRSGNFPKWKVAIQLMEEDQWKDFDYNVFSTTNIWPHKDFPLIEIGEFELNSLSSDQIEEFEKMAFAPGNLPTGIGMSPDYSLALRVNAYPKMQQVRLNKKINELPNHIKKDMELYKNNFVWLECQNRQDEEHYYSQPRNLWSLFDEDQKNRLYKNIAKPLSRANKETIDNVIGQFHRIHPDYAYGVAREIENNAKQD
jgi:catalase